MPLPEEQYGSGGPVMPSGGIETRSRGRLALDRDGASREEGGRPAPERGGVPLEVASDPRARHNLTRGGDWPSSEARLYRGGPVSLERSGVLPKGGQADCLVGRGFVLRVRLGSFVFVFYKFK
jgi:hypothetical protein